MPLYATPTQNAVQKTLSAQLLSGVTAAANLSDVVGLQDLPGVMVIDRVDTENVDTPEKREYISYTGISGNTVVGLTRNVDSGATDQTHAIGAVVEFVPDVVWATSMYTAISALVDPATLVADPLKIIVPSGLSAQMASQASYVNMHVSNSLEASGASISGVNIIVPTWFIPGYSSAPTVSVGSPVDMPISGTIEFASARLRTAISGASLVLDIMKNGTSIFATETRLSILGAGLYGSTASISDKIFVAGDYFSVDIDNGGWFGDLTIKFKAR